ncbi:MAG: nucleotidyltransferase domain-containing protein [Lachnospiraceae bacterium]|nr:nucleotidyltransferase domain-containing protein [Lachnospiraceae bacterium]
MCVDKGVEALDREYIIQVLGELPAELEKVYGDKLKKVVLYGSVARGMFNDESDVDIMLLVDMNRSELLEKEDALSEISTNLALEYLKFFSIIDVSYEEYDQWKDVLPLYKNIDKEGIVLYAA